MAIIAILMSVSFTSCGDDETTDFADYYIEVRAKGGDFTAQELSVFEAGINAELAEITLSKRTKEDAIYDFNSVIEEFRQAFRSGVDGVVGTLKLTFSLRTTNGSTVTSKTLNITKDGCTIS